MIAIFQNVVFWRKIYWAFRSHFQNLVNVFLGWNIWSVNNVDMSLSLVLQYYKMVFFFWFCVMIDYILGTISLWLILLAEELWKTKVNTYPENVPDYSEAKQQILSVIKKLSHHLAVNWLLVFLKNRTCNPGTELFLFYMWNCRTFLYTVWLYAAVTGLIKQPTG